MVVRRPTELNFLCYINIIRVTEWRTPTLPHPLTPARLFPRGFNSLGDDLREHSYALVCVWH